MSEIHGSARRGSRIHDPSGLAACQTPSGNAAALRQPERDRLRHPPFPALGRARSWGRARRGVPGREPVEESLVEAANSGGSWGTFVGLAALLGGGLASGLMSLVYYDRSIKRRRARPESVDAESGSRTDALLERLTPAHQLALMSPSESGFTTSARDWRSASPQPPASSASRSRWSSALPFTTQPRDSASSARCQANPSDRVGVS
jgi:hypothetical protein